MGIESLVAAKKSSNEKMVAVRLPPEIVRQIQAIRKSTGKTNAEIYSALLNEGLTAYAAAVGKKLSSAIRKGAVGKTSNGRRSTKKKAIKKKIVSKSKGG